MPGKNKKRPRIEDDSNRRGQSSARTSQSPSFNQHNPEHLSAFAAIRARQNESASDVRRLPNRNSPAGRLDADDWAEQNDRGADNVDDRADPAAGPAVRSSLERWKELLDDFPDEGSFSAFDAGERVVLNAGQALCIVGQYYVRVHSGGVHMCYSTLIPGSPLRRVIAPSTEPLPVIRSHFNETVVEISNMDARQDFETLGGVSPLFREIWTRSAAKSSSRPKRTYRMVADSREAYAHKVAHMDELSSWDDTINVLYPGTSPRVVFICGSSTSGKGLFARLLNNAWICDERQVAYLDLDPSRPEISLPGHISLSRATAPCFLPPFARQNPVGRDEILASQSVGDNAPRTAIDHYLRCVRALLEKVPEKWSQVICGPDIPSQSGGRLFSALISVIGATDIVFMSEKTKEAFKAAVSAPTARHYVGSNGVMHRLLRPQAEEQRRSLQAYFHSYKKLRPEPLRNHIPYELPYQEGKGNFLAVLVPGEVTCMPPNWLSTLLNGSIVTIVILDEDHPDREIKRSESDGIPYFAPNDDGEMEHLSPRHSRSAGLGLVRSIDAESKQLHVITPEPLGKMPRGRIVLELGGYDATWAYTEGGPSRPGMADEGEAAADGAPYVESRRKQGE